MSWAKWVGANDGPGADDFLRLVEEQAAHEVVLAAERATKSAARRRRDADCAHWWRWSDKVPGYECDYCGRRK